MTNPFIPWHGGECPVDPDTIIEVKLRGDPDYAWMPDSAEGLRWCHLKSADHPGSGDIVAYRVVS